MNITVYFKNPDPEGHIYMMNLIHTKPEDRREVARPRQGVQGFPVRAENTLEVQRWQLHSLLNDVRAGEMRAVKWLIL